MTPEIPIPETATEILADRVLEELRFALAEAEASPPPPDLRAEVLTGAELKRPWRRPLDEPPVITPLEGYRRTVESLDAILAGLSENEWRRPVLRDLSAQELVGHLIGVERVYQALLGLGSSATGGSDRCDHVPATQPDAETQRGRAPGETRLDWRRRCALTFDHLASLDPRAMDEDITLYGVTLSISSTLIFRLFEMWIHEEDIRRATGRPLLAPDPSRLALMTKLAVRALPKGLELAGRPRPGRMARIVLTGSGGGTWQAALGREAASTPDVRIVADATSFCRLVANRLNPTELGAMITGDETLGADVLAGAMALALD
jgi:uncharacterized protein (TIGR03083 family)